MLDAFRHVRALAEPVLDPSHIQAQLDLRAARNGVEEADALEAVPPWRLRLSVTTT